MAAFALAALALDAATYLAARRAVRTVTRANLERPARAALPQIADSMRVGLSEQGRGLLVPYLEGCLMAFGASYAGALDHAGDALAATGAFPEGASPRAGSRERLVDGRPVLELTIPVADDAGRLHGALVLGYPLSEALELERRVGLRAAALAALAGAAALAVLLLVVARTSEALRRGDERVRQSERLSAVGRLAAGIAHEINNPLGSILGFSQAALRREGVPAPVTAALSAIEEEARRCRRLVQDLLTFARRDAGSSAPFSVEDALDKTLALLEAQARLQGVAVERDWSARATVVGEKSRLQQAFINLASNALDAMPSGGRLTLRTRRGEAGGRPVVVVEVADTGPGIPAAARERVFEPFFTTKEAGRGTGLGLAIVQEVVHAHDGAVEVRDAPGGGTVFAVTLPLAA
ncbi:MAG: HAMP domain-containing sensor histidine kinase [Elusimicrobiota bacterium]|nr:HAMP domain-containing sensor histidine kinase [Elusimicrobiota bacterium]